MRMTEDHAEALRPAELERRTFLDRMASAVMAFGLAAGYGLFSAIGGRYLFPARAADTLWQFVLVLADVPPGESRTYAAPTGQRVVITRIGDAGAADDFIALSSVCPHLGCQVHWESQNDRFFCPCHNGAFDPSGVATAGPPKDAGQSLARYPLKVENGLLFIEVPSTSLV